MFSGLLQTFNIQNTITGKERPLTDMEYILVMCFKQTEDVRLERHLLCTHSHMAAGNSDVWVMCEIAKGVWWIRHWSVKDTAQSVVFCLCICDQTANPKMLTNVTETSQVSVLPAVLCSAACGVVLLVIRSDARSLLMGAQTWCKFSLSLSVVAGIKHALAKPQ